MQEKLPPAKQSGEEDDLLIRMEPGLAGSLRGLPGSGWGSNWLIFFTSLTASSVAQSLRFVGATFP